MNIKEVSKNIAWGFLAQTISIVVSFVMTFVVARFMDVTYFAFWQLFIFYGGYVYFLHLGIPDGIYLRIGGMSFEQVNKSMIKNQFQVMILLNSIAAVIISIISMVYITEIERIQIILFTCLYLIVGNMHNYYGMILQALNRVKVYSQSIIIDKTIFSVIMVILLILNYNHFLGYVIGFVICRFVSLIYLIINSKELKTRDKLSVKETIKETKTNVSIGINLTISVITSMMIIGFGRFAIDIHWGITTFGQLALTISLVNMIITFINQISIVLFPALRQISVDRIKSIYDDLHLIVGVFLLSTILFYWPLQYFVSLWLPKYLNSLFYLQFLLPIAIFDGKNQLISNTLLKVLKKERIMMYINVGSLLLSIILCIIGIFIFNEMTFILISMVLVIGLRYTITTIILDKILNAKSINFVFIEIFFVTVYFILVRLTNNLVLTIVYLILMVILYILMKSKIYVILQKYFRRIKNEV